MWLVIRVISILLGIAFCVLAYLIVLWVLAMLGLHVPPDILKVIFVIFALMVALWALTGRMDNTFNWPQQPPH